MRGNTKTQWLYRLLPIVLGVLFLAGAVGLMAPIDAQAEDALTPPELIADTTDNVVGSAIDITFEEDENWRTVISAVYVDDMQLPASNYNTDTAGTVIIDAEVFTEVGDYAIVIKAEGYTDASVTQKIETIALEIKGAGVETPKQYTLSHLQGMDQYRHLYSTINTWPTKNWYVAEGVKLRELLEDAGIKDEATQLRFISGDGFTATFTVQELLDEARYLFPHFKDNHEYFGYILGSPDDAEEVEPILALKSDGSDDFDELNDGDALHLIFGQRWLSEQTNAVFAKYVATVEVLTGDPGQWADPTADKASGEVPVGTLVRLDGPYNDTDKVHYTLDGSDPTVESPMYNWVAKRWWSSRSSDLDDINQPIEITEDTTIKAVVIGPSKYNSDIVEFNYTVPTVAPTAAFTADPTNGTAPLTVSFTDESTGTAPLTYAWDFDNDGTIDSTEQNPSYEYSEAGTYSVKLTVTNEAGSDAEVKTDYITVSSEPETPVFTITGDGVEGGSKEYTLNQLQALGETTAEYTSQSETNECTGVLLVDVLEDAGITNPVTEVEVVTADGFSHDSYSVTLQDVVDDDYLVTYLVNGESFEDEDDDLTSTIRIYRNYDDGSGWLNRLTLITGVEITEPSPSVDVTGVSIAESDQELDEGQTVQLTAVVEPEDATNKNVTWSSSDDAVATVGETGLVTAVAEGTATITVNTEDGDFTDTITVTVNEREVKTWYVDGLGSGDFTTIQAAVTAASSGDTIIVKDGTYAENVDVDKSLVIESENGADQTIVQAADSGDDVFYVTASDVTIDGFTASGAESMGKAGVKIFGSDSNSCTVKNNKCNGNSVGIAIEGTTKDNTVSNNTCTLNSSKGIYLNNTTGNSITNNTCSNITGDYTYALYLADNADNNTVVGNTSDSNDVGIRVKAADSNTIFNNTSSNNSIGLEIATRSKDNVFYLNNLMGNTSDLSAGTFAEAGNLWNSQTDETYEYDTQYTGPVGNYWGDYEGADGDGNGIGDTPYQTIATDADNYPLMGQWEDGVIAAPAVAPTAAFTADQSSGTAPLTVSFTDESTGTAPLTYAWDFDNDGTTDSTEQNPSYEYSEAGTYSVKLTVTNEAGSDEELKTDYITVTESSMDVLYDGTVALEADETFTVTAYDSSVVYTVYEATPLGALHAAANAGGFSYDVTDKDYAEWGVFLLDNVGSYEYENPGKWYAYVNDVFKDGYKNPAGALNLIELVDEDTVEFYYADGIADETDLNAVKAAATAAVKTVVDTDATTPTTWTLQLSGAKDAAVTKTEFEEGLACHEATWTDGDGNEWGGVPLWLLVAMVDDDPDVGDDHINFNDEIAEQGYNIKVIAGDGWDTTLDSADIARNDGYIVANTLNGEPLPTETEGGKGCWPLHLKGEEVEGGQQVGNIVRIELSGLPEPPVGWTLEMIGEVGDTITQEEFEEGLACTGSGHCVEWTDNEDKVWSGVPLWVLLGVVDDIEGSSHWTFNEDVAADGYTVKVSAEDFSGTFDSMDVANSDDYIIANEYDGEPLTGSSAPLRLVGDGVTKDDGSLGGSAVGNIVRIEIPELQTPEAEPGSWNLALNGKISDVISQAEFEEGLACPYSGHLQEWTDGDDNVWSGIPLWLLAGWVDDRQPHDYDANQAMAGYKILVKAGDGYAKEFASTDVTGSNDYIIANKCNGEALDESWPLRLVGDGVANDGSLTGTSVGNVEEIELTSFETVQPVPEVYIVKYDEDGTTVLDEITVDYRWMENEENGLDVIGDGTTVYKFQGITNDPENVWDPEETNLGGFKIENAVKGTRLSDLCGLVGGMGAGTEIVLVASDGFETRLPYASIYPDPSVMERQGDAILAWWADGEYVPDYADGMRLFFTPGGDNVYGQWDMHETLPENYWHYYYGGGVQYPSCAGLAAKWITEIEVYSIPQGDWTLELDGSDIGGLEYDVSKTYFEQALTCTMGANHKATYTDSQNRVWEGMPLWFLAGFVDDADQHSDNAFNDQLAEAGYKVVITAGDGYSVTVDSADIIRNSDYIIANTLDGAPIPDSDDNWPLRLVGPAVSGSASVSNIVSIELLSESSSGNGSGGGGGGGGGGITPTTPPETEISESITAATGGKVSCEQLTVEIPAGALPEDATFSAEVLTESDADEVVPEGLRVKLGSDVYEISTTGSRNFGEQTIAIKIAYDDAKIAEGEQPVLHYYDEDAGEWVALETTVVEEDGKRYAITHVNHLTKFAVFSAAVEADVIRLTIGQPAALVNGSPYTLDAVPFIDTAADRTLVPIRFVSEALGADVEWIAGDRQVRIADDGKVLILTIGSQEVLVDGAGSTIDCAPEIVFDRTFVPLRFISETLDAQVDYNAQTKEITITR